LIDKSFTLETHLIRHRQDLLLNVAVVRAPNVEREVLRRVYGQIKVLRRLLRVPLDRLLKLRDVVLKGAKELRVEPRVRVELLNVGMKMCRANTREEDPERYYEQGYPQEQHLSVALLL